MARKTKKRSQAEVKGHVYDMLMEKYQSHEIACNILSGKVWQGQTIEQLGDAIGLTTAMTERVMKTKTRRTYKYYPFAKNRYRLTVILEDDVVTSWKTA